MATTTPNFGWPVPTSTDLVKDGATAMEALGDAIDTSMVDLKGGTTGQVLAKASNTDMDFSWVAQDDSNAIQNTIVDAKGDLIAATAADTPARLAVGNNGETLVADSSTSTGLRYQGSQAAGKNAIINGGMDIWQRGTLFTNVDVPNYTADRFMFNRGGSATGANVSQSTDAPTGFQYSLKFQRASGNTSTANMDGYYAVETANSLPFAGKTVVFSLYVKKGANYSGGDISVTLQSGTGTDQKYYLMTGGVTVANTLSPNATPTTSWVRYYVTGTVATNATQLGFKISWAPTGTAGADDSLYFTGAQLELGSVPTSFTRTGGTIQGELAACQRYYEKSYNQATAPANAASTTNVQPIGVAYTTGVVRVGNVLFKVTKRAQPVITLYNTNVTASAGNWAYYIGGWGAPTSTSAATILQTGFLVDISKTSTFTAQNAYMTDGDWAADAEL